MQLQHRVASLLITITNRVGFILMQLTDKRITYLRPSRAFMLFTGILWCCEAGFQSGSSC